MVDNKKASKRKIQIMIITVITLIAILITYNGLSAHQNKVRIYQKMQPDGTVF